VSSPLKLSVTGSAEGKPSGFDAAITRVPARWYVTIDGQRVLNAVQAGRDMRDMSAAFAAGISEKLHHAEWTITGDPDEVTTLGLMHDCASCRAGVDQALTFLRENPGGEVAVGQLWWARPVKQALRSVLSCCGG
jgi:hypothetical protein